MDIFSVGLGAAGGYLAARFLVGKPEAEARVSSALAHLDAGRSYLSEAWDENADVGDRLEAARAAVRSAALSRDIGEDLHDRELVLESQEMIDEALDLRDELESSSEEW